MTHSHAAPVETVVPVAPVAPVATRSWRPAVRRLLLGVGMLAVAVPVGAALVNTQGGRRWPGLLELNAEGLTDGRWLPQVDVGTVMKVVLLLMAAVAVLLLTKVSRRSAVLLTAVIVASNLTIQGLKRPPGVAAPSLDGLNPLSGHVGLAAPLFLGALVVAPSAYRAVVGVVATVGLGGVCAAVVLAAWHSPAQVLCCLLLSLGWSLVASAVMVVPQPPTAQIRSELDPPADSRPRRARLTVVAAVGVTGLVVVGGALIASRGLGTGAADAGRAALLAVLVGIGGTLAAVAVVLSATRDPQGA